MSLSDDAKHELRMVIGNGTMDVSDAFTEDDTIEAMTDMVEAGERFAAILHTHGLPERLIVPILQGAAVQSILKRLED